MLCSMQAKCITVPVGLALRALLLDLLPGSFLHLAKLHSQQHLITPIQVLTA